VYSFLHGSAITAGFAAGLTCFLEATKFALKDFALCLTTRHGLTSSSFLSREEYAVQFYVASLEKAIQTLLAEKPACSTLRNVSSYLAEGNRLVFPALWLKPSSENSSNFVRASILITFCW
jgi:hypothetical protein